MASSWPLRWRVGLAVLGFVTGVVWLGDGVGWWNNLAVASRPVAAASATSATSATTIPTATAAVAAVSGNGDQTLSPFTANSSWHLVYSYDCKSLGQAGYFVVWVRHSNGGLSRSNLGPDVSGMSGAGRNYEPAAGVYSLQVFSTCDWKVGVTA